MSEAPTKFAFDTEFDAKGGVAFQVQRPKRLFPQEEVEQIREAARAEGERAALASIAAQQANALSQIAAACAPAGPPPMPSATTTSPSASSVRQTS